jgi:penicillin G amidase
MKRLQAVNYNPLAQVVTKLMLKYTNEADLGGDDKRFFSMIKTWDMQNSVDSKAATVFQVWYDSLERRVWYDELTQQDSVVYEWPYEFTLADALTKDSLFAFLDDIRTPAKETIFEQFAASLIRSLGPHIKIQLCITC